MLLLYFRLLKVIKVNVFLPHDGPAPPTSIEGAALKCQSGTWGIDNNYLNLRGMNGYWRVDVYRLYVIKQFGLLTVNKIVNLMVYFCNNSCGKIGISTSSVWECCHPIDNLLWVWPNFKKEEQKDLLLKRHNIKLYESLLDDGIFMERDQQFSFLSVHRFRTILPHPPSKRTREKPPLVGLWRDFHRTTTKVSNEGNSATSGRGASFSYDIGWFMGRKGQRR